MDANILETMQRKTEEEKTVLVRVDTVIDWAGRDYHSFIIGLM